MPLPALFAGVPGVGQLKRVFGGAGGVAPSASSVLPSSQPRAFEQRRCALRAVLAALGRCNPARWRRIVAQPSPFRRLPSSQTSCASTTPCRTPHTRRQSTGSPGSLPVPVALQPSPSACCRSSQVSSPRGCRCRQKPQAAPAAGTTSPARQRCNPQSSRHQERRCRRRRPRYSRRRHCRTLRTARRPRTVEARLFAAAGRGAASPLSSYRRHKPRCLDLAVAAFWRTHRRAVQPASIASQSKRQPSPEPVLPSSQTSWGRPCRRRTARRPHPAWRSGSSARSPYKSLRSRRPGNRVAIVASFTDFDDAVAALRTSFARRPARPIRLRLADAYSRRSDSRRRRRIPRHLRGCPLPHS